MRKIKIYLSRDCAEHLINSIDYGSATSDAECDEMERVLDDLVWANEHRDDLGRMGIKRETLDWVLIELCWYCSAYFNNSDSAARSMQGIN